MGQGHSRPGPTLGWGRQSLPVHGESLASSLPPTHAKSESMRRSRGLWSPTSMAPGYQVMPSCLAQPATPGHGSHPQLPIVPLWFQLPPRKLIRWRRGELTCERWLLWRGDYRRHATVVLRRATRAAREHVLDAIRSSPDARVFIDGLPPLPLRGRHYSRSSVRGSPTVAGRELLLAAGAGQRQQEAPPNGPGRSVRALEVYYSKYTQRCIKMEGRDFACPLWEVRTETPASPIGLQICWMVNTNADDVAMSATHTPALPDASFNIARTRKAMDSNGCTVASPMLKAAWQFPTAHQSIEGTRPNLFAGGHGG
ncbi:hypothetical protein P154DRAFT_577428 [Amniculicola lignicola CBS 123094]|uniref:Uncharacterized protein n=1 Tax=Amniculicola lignicola CBS 123094 TaxID=1392246 RepID=A0A6A5WBJ1_9PLEO|nr:hypothetical protein P154DRAFT_577428 [Amniculicola lignicola CBS 123094]